MDVDYKIDVYSLLEDPAILTVYDGLIMLTVGVACT